MNLAKAAQRTVNRFYVKGIYEDNLSISLDSKKRLYVSPNGGFDPSTLERIVQKNNPRKIIFGGLEPDNKKVSGIVGPRHYYNRVILEICKNLSSPDYKNKILRTLGMIIGDGVTITPNVYLDFINPQLISIGDGTVIGENAVIGTHFLYPRRYEIGKVKIGKECIIGGGALVSPGVIIGDYAEIQANTVIYKDVPRNGKVLLNQKFLD